MANFIKTILNANIRMIFYNGDLDMRCNMLMGQRFTEKLGYKVGRFFLKISSILFLVVY